MSLIDIFEKNSTAKFPVEFFSKILRGWATLKLRIDYLGKGGILRLTIVATKSKIVNGILAWFSTGCDYR